MNHVSSAIRAMQHLGMLPSDAEAELIREQDLHLASSLCSPSDLPCVTCNGAGQVDDYDRDGEFVGVRPCPDCGRDRG